MLFNDFQLVVIQLISNSNTEIILKLPQLIFAQYFICVGPQINND